MSLKILIVYFLGSVIIMLIVYNNLPYYPYPDHVSMLGNKENTLKFVNGAPMFLAPYPGKLYSKALHDCICTCMLFSRATKISTELKVMA